MPDEEAMGHDQTPPHQSRKRWLFVTGVYASFSRSDENRWSASLAGFSDAGLKPTCDDVQAGFSFLQTRRAETACSTNYAPGNWWDRTTSATAIHDRLASS